MNDGQFLRRLADTVSPPVDERDRVKQRVLRRIRPPLADLAASVTPPIAVRDHLRARIRRRITLSGLATDLPTLAHGQEPDAALRGRIKQSVMQRLQHVQSTFLHASLKWTAAFALFLLVAQSLPRVLLAPTLRADSAVQLVPQGRVTLTVGSIAAVVDSPQVLRGPSTVSTGDHVAIITLNDDGQIRFDAHTVGRLNDISDRPQVGAHPTFSLKTGRVWVLGMLSPLVQPITIETSQGVLSVHAASLSIADDGTTVTIDVFDKGVAFQREGQEVFLVGGEHAVIRKNTTIIPRQTRSAILADPWVSTNLLLDGSQRQKVLMAQEDRRKDAAGILPTSYLYPAKRLAEVVDIALTPGDSARAQKKLQLADTRLNEAIALLSQGDSEGADASMVEYRTTLLDVATASGDNLVRFLIKKQVDEASADVAIATPNTALYSLKQTVLDLSKSLPIAQVKPADAQGYVFVDKLAALNQSLLATGNLTGAVVAYRDLRPYAQGILSSNGANPLLQREARALLAKTSSLIGDVGRGKGDDAQVSSLQKDLEQYLPVEPAAKRELVFSEDKLNAQVQQVVDNIFSYKMPRSRYNVLMNAIADMRGDPNYGAFLRRLKAKLPPYSLAGYVQAEISAYSAQLKAGEGKL